MVAMKNGTATGLSSSGGSPLPHREDANEQEDAHHAREDAPREQLAERPFVARHLGVQRIYGGVLEGCVHATSDFGRAVRSPIIPRRSRAPYPAAG